MARTETSIWYSASPCDDEVDPEQCPMSGWATESRGTQELEWRECELLQIFFSCGPQSHHKKLP